MKKNILVIMGGESTEHDISLITGVQAINNINKDKYAVYPVIIDKQGKWHFSFSFFCIDNILHYFDKTKQLGTCLLQGKILYLKTKNKLKKLADIDCGILCCHGGNGENGALQGLFEVHGVPIVSPSHTFSGLFMDKHLSKVLFENLNIKTPKYQKISKEEYSADKKLVLEKIIKTISAPYFVKPNSQGSSIGVSKANNKKELATSIEGAFVFDNEVLIEECVNNLCEFNIAVCSIDKKTRLSCIEKPCNKNKLLTFEDKYLKGDKSGLNNMGRELPAKMTNEQEDFVKASAQKVYDNYIKSGIVRIDYLCNTKTGEIWINEVNTIPGSLSFYLWKGEYTFETLLDSLISEAIANCSHNNIKTTFESCVLRQYGGGSKGSKVIS